MRGSIKRSINGQQQIEHDGMVGSSGDVILSDIPHAVHIDE